MSRRRALALLLAGLVFMALQGVMRVSRRAGVNELDTDTLESALTDPESYLSSEGMLRVNAWVNYKRAYERPGRALENAFILYWWVPRSWWEDKPTMEGHWLISDVMDEGYFSEEHSVAGGFAMPALLDFGPFLGALFCVVYGACLAWVERFCRRRGELTDHASVLVGISLFGVFFTMRGLHTGIIFMMLCAAWYVPFALLDRRRARRSAVTAFAPRRRVLAAA